MRPLGDRARGGWHYQGSVFDLLHYPFDLMIAHPPCTHLSVSGARHFTDKRMDGRQHAAASFFMALAHAPIERIAIENPVCIMSSLWREPDQIIQPYHFGHDASKATCLWLKNLPRLRPTSFVEPRVVDGKNRWSNQTDSGQNKLGPSEDRWKVRAETYQGIAEAMADQWGSLMTIGESGCTQNRGLCDYTGTQTARSVCSE